jgi:hypothetical protein
MGVLNRLSSHAQFTETVSGEISGSTTVKQLPNVKVKMVKFKATASNTGNVYLGGQGVTIPNGTQDNTSGFELDAKEETGWMPAHNLNQFYLISNNNGDDLVYLALV